MTPAPLHVVFTDCGSSLPRQAPGGCRSRRSPISTFDQRLLYYATANWQKAARLVAHALASQMDDHLIQVGDRFLAARIDAIVKSGGLEMQGKSALEMNKSLVRLPQ
jgi:hypothetical protein